MKYSQIVIGHKAYISHKITYHDLLNFRVMSGDKNSIHLAEENGPIYGMFIMSLISALIGNLLPGDGAIWIKGDYNFIKPIHVGDEIRILADVKAKDESLNAIKMQIDVYRENDVCVMTTCWVKVPV